MSMAPTGSGGGKLQCEPVFDIIADRIKAVSACFTMYINVQKACLHRHTSIIHM